VLRKSKSLIKKKKRHAVIKETQSPESRGWAAKDVKDRKRGEGVDPESIDPEYELLPD
jgi:hypothetical protein